MERLRNISQRPQFVGGGDPAGSIMSDAARPSTQVGQRGLVAARIVEALPLNKGAGAQILQPPRALADSQFCYLADPSGNLVGDRAAIFVHRMVTATKAPNTRRL